MRVKHDVAYPSGYATWMRYTVRVEDATEAEILRAERILNGAKLAIEDNAPLFDGPAPLNTNESDIDNYREGK